jgi:uncharacterized protein YqhQ
MNLQDKLKELRELHKHDFRPKGSASLIDVLEIAVKALTFPRHKYGCDVEDNINDKAIEQIKIKLGCV